jgi:hypothetical protein
MSATREPLCIYKIFNRSHRSILAVASNEKIAMDIAMRLNFARNRKNLTLTEITASFVDEQLARPTRDAWESIQAILDARIHGQLVRHGADDAALTWMLKPR